MKLLGSFSVNFSIQHRMRIPITKELYDAVQQEVNPLMITGYLEDGSCLFSYLSGVGKDADWSYKKGRQRRWDGAFYSEYSRWRESRKISIKPDFISFHKMPYGRECDSAVVTLAVLTHTSYDKGTIQL